jgi:hypothetical protein
MVATGTAPPDTGKVSTGAGAAASAAGYRTEQARQIHGERSALWVTVTTRVAEPENLKTVPAPVPVPTYHLNTVPVPAPFPVPVPAPVPGHVHTYTYTNTYVYVYIYGT